VKKSGYDAQVAGAVSVQSATDDTEKHLVEAQRRLLIAWALTLPVAILMFLHMTHLWMPPHMDLVEVLLAVPVVAIAGAQTFEKGFKTARHLAPNMDALIALGTAAAFITGP